MIKEATLLIRFLKEHKALESFMYNFFKRDCRKNICFREYAKKTDELCYVDFAFYWDETNEGWDYWHRLNTLWNDFMKKIKTVK